MMTTKLYADENIPKSVISALRKLGHNVLTVSEAGQANQRIPDTEVLAYATQLHRAVITLNRNDFIQLHKVVKKHAGIIVCREDHKHPHQLAQRIHAQLLTYASLDNQLVRVNKLK
jgi:predicted nuclease of predicted toxin-antitoxin system